MTKKTNILIAIIAACVVAALFLGNPASEAWPLKCPLYHLTGWQCPICGTQRAIHEMLHGNIRQAWAHNPALWIALPHLLLLTAANLWPSITNNRTIKTLCGNKAIFTTIGLLAAWGIIRNLI